MKDLLAKATIYQESISKEDLQQVFSYWEVDLENRRPAPAMSEEGEFKGSDFDLSSFLQAISRRHAVINIPVYKSRRPASHTEGETIVSKNNRHGRITGLFANKELFSFGVRIDDANVITTDSVGAPRNFMLVDVSGEWHTGWREIQWKPDAKENEFLTKNKLWTGNQVVFKNFVHPALANSIYGIPYRTVKVLAQRLTEEAQFLHGEVARLQEAGIKFPPADAKTGGPSSWPKTEKEEGKSIKVPAFEAELDFGVKGTFAPLAKTEAALLTAYKQRKEIVNHTVPQLTFIARSVELAFVRHNTAKFESTTHKWEKDYVIPGKKIKWGRVALGSDFYLRARETERSTTVAK